MSTSHYRSASSVYTKAFNIIFRYRQTASNDDLTVTFLNALMDHAPNHRQIAEEIADYPDDKSLELLYEIYRNGLVLQCE